MLIVFPAVMYGCKSRNIKKAETLKNWCFWTVVLEKTLESPLDCKEIQPVHPKDQSWVFIGKTDVEAETPIIWPSDAKSWLFGMMLGKIAGRRRRGWQRMRWWFDGITNSMDMGLGGLWQLVMEREVWRAVVHGVSKCQTWLSDWTELINKQYMWVCLCVYIYMVIILKISRQYLNWPLKKTIFIN